MGKAREEIKKKWLDDGETACFLGTNLHDCIGKWFNGHRDVATLRQALSKWNGSSS